jgi:hypothetical protein
MGPKLPPGVAPGQGARHLRDRQRPQRLPKVRTIPDASGKPRRRAKPCPREPPLCLHRARGRHWIHPNGPDRVRSHDGSAAHTVRVALARCGHGTPRRVRGPPRRRRPGRVERRAGPRSSGIALENIDQRVRPQDDFYRHVNGAWLERTEIPSDRSNYGSFTQLSDEAEENLRALVEEAAAMRSAAPGGATPRRWAPCTAASWTRRGSRRWDRGGAAGAGPVAARAGRTRSCPSLLGRHGACWAGSGPVRQLRVHRPDAVGPAHHVHGQGGLGLPDRDYYFREGEQFEQVRARTATTSPPCSGSAGTRRRPDAAAEAVMELETAGRRPLDPHPEPGPERHLQQDDGGGGRRPHWAPWTCRRTWTLPGSMARGDRGAAAVVLRGPGRHHHQHAPWTRGRRT